MILQEHEETALGAMPALSTLPTLPTLSGVAEDAAVSIPAPVKRLYKAGELSRRTGLTRQALHQYVLMGLLEPDDVTKGGQRLFSDKAEALVKLIRKMCENGYTLKDVKDIFIKTRG